MMTNAASEDDHNSMEQKLKEVSLDPATTTSRALMRRSMTAPTSTLVSFTTGCSEVLFSHFVHLAGRIQSAPRPPIYSPPHQPSPTTSPATTPHAPSRFDEHTRKCWDSNNLTWLHLRVESDLLCPTRCRGKTRLSVSAQRRFVRTCENSFHSLVFQMAMLMDGAFQQQVSQFIVVDCRFAYEYVGGHIRNAVNLNTHGQLLSHFFHPNGTVPKVKSSSVVIFHCEFSSHRGPRMALFLRSQDRILNGATYPHLNFPEIYILEGGYKNFFATHKVIAAM